VNILYDSAHPAKSNRRRLFAVGLSPSPHRRPYTSADLAWAAQNLNARARDYQVVGAADVALEQAAGQALAQARMDHGFPPF
jgi:hypothetical protein